MTPQIKKTGLPVAILLSLFLCLAVQQSTAQNNARNGVNPPAVLTGLQGLQQKKLKTSETISTPQPVRPRQHAPPKPPGGNCDSLYRNRRRFGQSKC